VKISEAENSLPNGLHDADLLSYDVDLEKQQAKLIFNADFSRAPKKQPEHRKIVLLIEGLKFVSIPAPQSNYEPKRDTAWVTGFEPWRDDLKVDKELKEAVIALEPHIFCEWTFVVNWNRFIVIAAQGARIEIEA
jgi:hypothetical protein